jgi:hypothetical protein
MGFDIFISHSSKDRQFADLACATLERSGVRCWIAPRDIKPGDEYGAAIVHAIDRCRAMVLIFSSNANTSRQIPRELERAVSRGVPILPVRIEDVIPKGSIAYFVDSVHWFDAITPPLEDHLQRLADSANKLLQSEEAPHHTRADESPQQRLSIPSAMRLDQPRSTIWSSVGKFAAKSLIVCAGLLVVTYTASLWFGGDDEPPSAAVAERAVAVPAKTAADAPTKAPAAQGASQTVDASKADVHDPVVEPVVKEANRSVSNGTADSSPSDAPQAGGIVATAKEVPPPEDATRSPGAPPSPVLSSGGKASPHFTAEDARRVEQIAADKKFPLPKYQIEDIDPQVPAKYRRYVGIWASKIGFNGGAGREGIIILSDVDAQGNVTGVYASGPPTPSSYQQSPAWSRVMSGKIKDDVLSFVLGTASAVVHFSPPNALFITWTFHQTGRTATDIFYPVWILSEHENGSSVAQTRKPK